LFFFACEALKLLACLLLSVFCCLVAGGLAWLPSLLGFVRENLLAIHNLLPLLLLSPVVRNLMLVFAIEFGAAGAGAAAAMVLLVVLLLMLVLLLILLLRCCWSCWC
jgi:hypothetical protein